MGRESDEREAAPGRKRGSSAKTGEHKRRVGPQNKQGLEVGAGREMGVQERMPPRFWCGDLLDGGISY